MKSRKFYLFLLAVSFVALVCIGCAPAQRWLDRRGIKDYAHGAELELDTRTEALKTPWQSVELDEMTSPVPGRWKTTGPPPWSSKRDHLRAEIWSYESAGPRDNLGATTFWVWRHGELGARPVILWLPGNGFAPIAFPFVSNIYETIMDLGFDLVVWVPPKHFNRLKTGETDSLMGPDVRENQELVLESVREIRAMIHLLRSRGVERIGGWGGSMGASVLWLVSAVEDLDHMALMIPVVDWRTLSVEPAEMKTLVQKIEARGVPKQVLSRAFETISPVSWKSRVSPNRIFIQHGVYDQLTPDEVLRDFTQSQGIRRIQGYARSHATILLTPTLYVDYRAFLEEMKNPPRTK